MFEPDQEKSIELPVSKPSSMARWFLPFVALTVMLGVGLLLHGKLRKEIWSYFTDDQGTRVEVQEGKARYILWQDPRQSLFHEEGSTQEPAPINQASGRLEAAFIVVVKTVSLAESFHEVVVVRRRVILILPVHRRFIDILILP